LFYILKNHQSVSENFHVLRKISCLAMCQQCVLSGPNLAASWSVRYSTSTDFGKSEV